MIYQNNIKQKPKEMGPPTDQYHQESTGAIQPRNPLKNSKNMFWGVGWPPRVLPNVPMVPIASTTRNAIKSTTSIFHHSQYISLCLCPCPPQFYAQATSPFVVPFIGTWESRKKRKLVRSCNRCMDFGLIDGTPSIIQRVQQTHKI